MCNAYVFTPLQSSVLEKDNLEAKVEVLANLSSKAVLPGAVYDCIVFHDGYSWRYIC